MNVPQEFSGWIIGFPLIGFLIQALLGKQVIRLFGQRLGKWIMGALAVIPIAISFVLGLAIMNQLTTMPADARSIITEVYPWITLQSIHIPFEILLDPLSITMVLIITGVGSLIHLYATGYMAEEKDYTRFFTYLNLFIAFMLVLVLGNNLAMMFIGWEGVGLCSYLLIGFWYKDTANAKAANKAFIVNRIGDWGLTLGIFLLVAVIAGNADRLDVRGPRWLSYDVLLPNCIAILQDYPAITTAIALLLFLGACGKSAQLPLYFWLPDAMAGPTPVSALIHAATMVTAGVFMLNRLHVIFELSPVASAVVAIVGAATALFTAVIAFGQTDIKKVLAYSTVSQLGFMFIACGAGAYWAGMFHVTTHAFFKALLFLGSGAVIHAMAHDQDIRNYGGLAKWIKITCATMVIGWLAISGLAIPIGHGYGMAGFYSKEAILGAALGNHLAEANHVNWGYWAGWVGLFVAALTAAYMTRMTMLTFFGPKEQWRAIPAEAHHHAEDAHHAPHHEHGHDHDDTFDFYYSDDELAHREAAEPHEHHHALDANHKPHEVPISMWLPLVVLALLSIGGGYYLADQERFLNWLYPTGLSVVPAEAVPGHPHDLPLLWLSVGAAAIGILYGLIVYWKGLPKKEGWDMSRWSPFRRKALNQFGYDQFVVEAGVEGGAGIGNFLWKRVDVGIVDGIVNGLANLSGALGVVLRFFQTGYVRNYALLMMAGGVALVGWIWWTITKGGIN